MRSAMHREHRLQHRGFSLIEIMVGVVIGLIAVLVIYQVFAAAEGIKRNTTSVGDAQQNGLLSSFILGIELANAANGVADAIPQLGTCTATVDPATNFRPIPLLITDGGADTTPDTFVVNYSVSQRVVTPVEFFGTATAGSDFQVHSLTGFRPGDLMIAISMKGDCAVSRATAVVADPQPPAPDGDDVVKISHTGVGVDMPAGAFLLNMGPQGGGQRVQFDVAGGVMRSTALWNATGAAVASAPNPIASNVLNMKLLYGIENVGGGVTWVQATGAWSAANVLAAPTTTLGKIKAVRIGLVVQGEQFDKAKYDQDLILHPKWKLFGTVLGTALEGDIPPGFRVRVYETAIPLRNPMWNPTS